MLYIMRHGRTDWNEAGRLQGRTDIPLNAAGRAMAAAAAAACRAAKLDICFCSPLSRARETAEIVLKDSGVPVFTDERLTEMSFGIYEGVSAGAGAPAPIKTMFEDPSGYLPQGGAESFGELYARTGGLLSEVIPLSESGKNVLIVGHGAVNACIICRTRGIPLEKFWSALTENCKLIRLL